MKKRLEKIRKSIAEKDCDCFLITNLPNIFYVSAFTGSLAVCVITQTDTIILVDSRYTLQAKRQCKYFDVVTYSAVSTNRAVADTVNSLNSKTVGVESDYLTLTAYDDLKSLINSDVSFVQTSGIVEDLRMIKSPDEIQRIRRCIAISDSVFDLIVDEVKIGKTEKQMAAFIDNAMRTLGAECSAFKTIAASGENSALPHAYPTDRKISSGDFFLTDYGARMNHYNSDITRTVCIGDPNKKQFEIYNTVLMAQKKAIEAIKPGIYAKEIDVIARNYISNAGYGDCFGHSLGHSLGIEVHDGVGFSPKSEMILSEGMVITVEPGIYIEELGGVRIEDNILVTKDGVENLTGASKALIVI